MVVIALSGDELRVGVNAGAVEIQGATGVDIGLACPPLNIAVPDGER